MTNSVAAGQTWNVACYEQSHAFVWQYGEALIDLLAPQVGDRILDLGCGPGQLTHEIAARGSEVMGIDADPSMIETAQRHFPDISFAIADARSFQVKQPVDAVFSNAVLHWIKDADAVIHSIYHALKPQGRFVAEFGGQGNIATILTALNEALQSLGYDPEPLNPWYFPGIGEYSQKLESQGFEVRYAVLFDRPTPLEGAPGLANWLQMFAQPFLTGLNGEERSQVIQSVEQATRPVLYRDGQWQADYRRLRIVAVKL